MTGGLWHLRIVADANGNQVWEDREANNTRSLEFTLVDSLASWASDHGLSGSSAQPAANPAGDGLSNRLNCDSDQRRLGTRRGPGQQHSVRCPGTLRTGQVDLRVIFSSPCQLGRNDTFRKTGEPHGLQNNGTESMPIEQYWARTPTLLEPLAPSVYAICREFGLTVQAQTTLFHPCEVPIRQSRPSCFPIKLPARPSLS